MIKLDISPIKALDWKRRSSFVPKSETNDETHDDRGDDQDYRFDLGEYLESRSKDYAFQARNLLQCLERLVVDKGKFPNIDTVEFVLFPEERSLDEGLRSFFEENYSLEFLEVEPFGEHSRAYFRVVEWEELLTSLRAHIGAFMDAAVKNELSDLQGFLRITLVKEIRLHAPKYFDLVQRPSAPVRKFRVSITQIAKSKMPLEEIVSRAQSLGLDVAFKQYGTLSETEIVSQMRGEAILPATIDSFLNSIAHIPEIKRIFLDKVSSVSKTGFETLITTALPSVEEVANSAPVVGIIDTGVESNHYTEGSLVGERGFCLCDEEDTENPQSDPIGHGTAVASRLLYGHTLHSHIIPERRALLPVARILPIRILANGDLGEGAVDLDLDYRKLFSLNGKLAAAVRDLKIKILNLSLNKKPSESLTIQDRRMSVEGALVDRFAKEMGVVVVISGGNIEIDELNQFIAVGGKDGLEYPDEDDARTGFVLKTLPPADFQSGISVGGCWSGQNAKKVYPAWFNRFTPSRHGKIPAMPLCLAIGGDYLLRRSDAGSVFTASSHHSKSLIVLGNYGHFNSDDHLFFDHGTSFAAPHVTRALAIASAQFPEASAETIKGIFLHRAYAAKQVTLNKPTDDQEGEHIALCKGFGGECILSNKDELDFLNNNNAGNDEVTYVVEGEIAHEKILSYDIPLAGLRSMMEGKADHMLKVRVSVSALPLLPSDYAFDEPILYKEANKLHLATCLHSEAIDPIETKLSTASGSQKMLVKSITKGSSDWAEHGLVNWTIDYYTVLQKSFSTRSERVSWEEFSRIAGNGDNVRLSTRCHIQDSSQQKTLQKFTMIVTFEDLGAYAKTRADVGLVLDLKVH